MERPGSAAMQALATLTEPGEVLYLARMDGDPLPACWAIEANKPMLQMILDRPAEAPALAVQLVVLGPADAGEMGELAALTHPGPFGPELDRLGLFLGVREQSRLVAMVGQRFRVPGFVEISGVCTHPNWQGRAFARALMNQMAREIQRQGDTPFLHVIEANVRAAGVYARMGFTLRQRLSALVVRRMG